MTTPTGSDVRAPTHAFTVDLENFSEAQTRGCPSENARLLRRGTDRLLDLLARHGVRATWFVLGAVAASQPALVRRVHRAGHEIAVHGHGHVRPASLSPASFQDDLRRAIDAAAAATGERPRGYRAPFLLGRPLRWMPPILAREGIRYDASLRPNPLRAARRRPHRISLPDGGAVLEVPIASLPLGPRALPIGGGLLFAVSPYAFLRRGFRHLERREGRFVVYTHPWELTVSGEARRTRLFTWRARITDLRPRVDTKLRRLLADFRFAPIAQAYAPELEAADASSEVAEERPTR